MPLKVLDYLSRKRKIPSAKELHLLAIQHVLNDSVDFFRCLVDQPFAKVSLIGVPYSFKKDVGTKIESLGVPVISPRFDEIYTKVRSVLLSELKLCQESKKKLLILEDGGYAAPLLHQDQCWNYISNCLGVVEQTKNGLWLDQNITNLSIPVVHVAESNLKDAVEAPAVGEAVARTLEDFLGELGVSISRFVVGILGYGAIGSNIAKRLAARKARILISDLRVERNIAARFEGFWVMPKPNLIGEADLIVGATGRTSICRDDLLSLKHLAYVASASSKNIEIDIKELEYISKEERRIHAEIVEHKLINDRTVHVLSNGFPINFRGRFSVPNDVMDLILSELYLSMVHITKAQLSSGIYQIPLEHEREIARLWERMY